MRKISNERMLALKNDNNYYIGIVFGLHSAHKTTPKKAAILAAKDTIALNVLI